MQNRKKVGFILFSTLFLMILMPAVFALFESLSYFVYEPFDLYAFYINWQLWIDFILFFMLFSSISRIIFGKMFGGDKEEEPPALKALYVSLGAILAFGMILLERTRGWSLLEVGPLAAILFIMFLGILVYFLYGALSGKETKLGLGKILLFILLLLFLASLMFPDEIGPIWDAIFEIPILRAIIILLLLIGLASLLGWLFGGIKEKLGGLGGGKEKGSKTPATPSERNGGAPAEKEPKVKPIRVKNIIVYPDKEPHSPGETLNLIADVERKKGWFGWGSATGRIACTWHIDGIQQSDKNTNIQYTIPQATAISKNIQIVVVAQDLDNPKLQARATRTIKVASHMPSLIITSPVDTRRTRNLTANVGDTLNLSYILESQGAAPPSVADTRWVYILGNVKGKELRGISNGKVIGDGNNLSVTINQGTFSVQPGTYTIVCIAIDKNGKLYQLPGGAGLLADDFKLEIKGTKGPKEKFFVDIVNSQNNNQIAHTDKDFKFDTGIGEKYYFEVGEENGNIGNYNIEINSNNLQGDIFVFDKNHKPPLAVIELKSPGKKKIICVFREKAKNKEVKKIEIIINVKPSGTTPTPPVTPPTPGAVKFNVTVKDGKGNIKATGENDFSVDTSLKGKLFFFPDIVGQDKDNYYFEVNDTKKPRPDRFGYTKNAKPPQAFLEVEDLGEKEITTTFKKKSGKFYKKDETVSVIKVKVKVTSGLVQPTAEFGIKITNNRSGVFKFIKIDTSEIANTGETFTLTPLVQNDNIKNYQIKWQTKNLDKSDTLTVNIDSEALLATVAPGEKKLTCTFESNGQILNKITVIFKVAKGTTPQPKPKFSIRVRNQAGIAKQIEKDDKFDAVVSQVFYLEPEIKNDNPQNYIVDWTDKGLVGNDALVTPTIQGGIKGAEIEFGKEGKKELVASFRRAGETKLLTTITVKFDVQPALSLPIIKRPIKREESKKNPYVISHGIPVDLECTDSPGVKIKWVLQANHKEQMSTDTIKELGTKNKITTVFNDKFPNLIPAGEYTIFLQSYQNNTLMGIDFIWINIIEKQGTKAEFSLLTFKDKNGKRNLERKDKQDFILDAKISELYYFAPRIEKETVANYKTEIISTGTKNDLFEPSKDKSMILGINSPGIKTIICTFTNKKDGKKAAITATINVIAQIPPPEEEPKVKIIKINGKEVKSGATVNVPLNKQIEFEAVSNNNEKIDSLSWFFSTDKAFVGKGQKIKLRFPIIEAGKEIFKENEEEPLYLVAYKDKRIVKNAQGKPVSDLIKLRLIK